MEPIPPSRSVEDPSPPHAEETLAFSSDMPAAPMTTPAAGPTVGGEPLSRLIEHVRAEHESRGARRTSVPPSQKPAPRAGITMRPVVRALIAVDEQGARCIGGTRVSLDSVVIAYGQGKSPEEIQQGVPALSLEQVYLAIAHYLGHRQDVDAYLRRRQVTPYAWIERQQLDPATADAKHTSDATAPPPENSSHEDRPFREGGASDAGPGSDAETAAPGAAAPNASTTTVPPAADRSSAAHAAADAPTAPPPTHSATSSDPMLRQIETSGKLGPFEIVNKLGQGGMGAVYLARQVSLDRNVAVKVLNSKLSRDASFVARFTREAYAAAQLTHHNIVQIHDIGEERDVHFFSMEFVEGRTLKGLVKSGGRVEPASAVGYILQAARGLKFAHDHCLIHRDIKPENLMLNDQGLVKVADLGLVKRKGITDEKISLLALASDASMTGAAAAMGTPAYMPPEQATDAASVDVRADIYSLGCTLYDLLTGRPPFTGRTAVEIITKHATEAVIPPDKFVSDVPQSLSAILLKMMAKRPEQRYASMDVVIEALEEYITVSTGGTAGPIVPRQHHAVSLERAVSQFNSAGWESVRRFAIFAYFGVGIVGLLGTLWGSHLKGVLRALWDLHLKIAVGLLGLMAMTFLCYALVSAFSRRAYLSRQVRQLISSASPMDWVQAGLAGAVVIGALAVLHLQLLALACLAASFLIALAFHSTIDRAIRNERRTSLMQAQDILKAMRQQGMDEDELRLFVCEHAGTKWEEIYRALFGSESRIPATLRRKLNARGLLRRKWGALGNPILSAIDARMRQRQEERQLQYFVRIEERKLLAQGMTPHAAQDKARQIAQNLIARARLFKDALDDSQLEPTPARVDVNVLLADEGESGGVLPQSRQTVLFVARGIAEAALGPPARLVGGLLMVAVFLLWLRVSYPTLPTLLVQEIHQGMDHIRSGEFKPHVAVIAAGRPPGALAAEDSTVNAVNQSVEQITRFSDQNRRQVVRTEKSILRIFGSWEGGLAGALLVISSLFRRFRVGLIMLGSTFLILVAGRYLVLPTEPLLPRENAGVVLGAMLAIAGFICGRERRRFSQFR